MSFERNRGLNSGQERPEDASIDNGRVQFGQQDSDWLQEGPYAGLGPSGSQRSDERICEDVCEGLTWYEAIDVRQIQVSVVDREVTLAGTVESEEAYRMAENIALAVSGVRTVHNQLDVYEVPQNQQDTGEYPDTLQRELGSDF